MIRIIKSFVSAAGTPYITSEPISPYEYEHLEPEEREFCVDESQEGQDPDYRED